LQLPTSIDQDEKHPRSHLAAEKFDELKKDLAKMKEDSASLMTAFTTQ